MSEGMWKEKVRPRGSVAGPTERGVTGGAGGGAPGEAAGVVPFTRLLATRPARERREALRALCGSILLHLGLIALLLWIGTVSGRAKADAEGVGDGIGAGLAGGGGGGGADEVIELVYLEPAPAPAAAAAPVEEPLPAPPPPPPPVLLPEPTPTALPEPELAVLEVSPPPVVPALAGTPSGTGSGAAGGVGPGLGPGLGPGSGGGSGGGEGGGIGSGIGPGTGKGRVLAPAPEVLLVPPPAPGSVRGKTIIVRLAIDDSGVVRDVELVPPTGDRKYDAALRRVALGWRFRPARDAANRPVAVTFDVTFTF